MKKTILFILAFALLLLLAAAPAYAADESFTYETEITSGGSVVNDLSSLPAGTKVTVTVSLTRNDIAEGETYDAWGLELDISDFGLDYVSGTGFTMVKNGDASVIKPSNYWVGGVSGTGLIRFYTITSGPDDVFTLDRTVSITADYTVTAPAEAQIVPVTPIIYLGGKTEKEADVQPAEPVAPIVVQPYVVTFDAAGGTVSGSATVEVEKGRSLSLPAAILEGSTFTGWSDGENIYPAGSNYTPSGDVTLTALWQNDAPPSLWQGEVPPAPPAPTGTVTVKPAGEGSINEDGTISVTASGPVQVKVTGVSSGQVAAVVDGSGRVTDIIEKSLVENGAAYFCLPGSANVKIINNAASFTDVRSSDWYASAVTFASSHELFSGMGNGIFAPGAQMTRGMLVTVLWRLEDKPAAASALSFSDVASGDYFYTAVQWAAANGIVKGYTDGSFQPNKSITREEMAALLNRYMDYLGRDTSVRGDLSRFSDGDKVSAWAADNLSWANGAGVITGRPDGTVDPQGTATRAEVAAMLQRIVSALVK